MLTITDVLKAVKSRQGLPSNYALARLLDVPESTVSRWNTGKNLPDDGTAALLARLGDLDEGEVLASLYAARAIDDEARQLWARVAARLARGGAVACVILSLGGITGGPDAGAQAAQTDPNPRAPVCYVNRRARLAVVLFQLVATARRISAWLDSLPRVNRFPPSTPAVTF